MHIYLVGFMGSGKSTVGRSLAELLERDFIDLDQAVEEMTGSTIAEIFRKHGEPGFRRRESAALRSIPDDAAAVIATGGGLQTVAENRRWMAERGVAVWLDVPFEVVVERLREYERGTRPLFQSEAQARELFDARRRHYRDSDIRIEISSADSAPSVADSIRAALRERPCGI